MSAQALGVLGFIAEWAKQLRWREKNENLLIAIWSFLPVQAVKKSVFSVTSSTLGPSSTVTPPVQTL